MLFVYHPCRTRSNCVRWARLSITAIQSLEIKYQKSKSHNHSFHFIWGAQLKISFEMKCLLANRRNVTGACFLQRFCITNAKTSGKKNLQEFCIFCSFFRYSYYKYTFRSHINWLRMNFCDVTYTHTIYGDSTTQKNTHA